MRYAAAVVIGDLKYQPAKTLLLKMTDHQFEQDKGVFAAVVYALYELGNIDHTEELGRLLFDTERDIRPRRPR